MKKELYSQCLLARMLARGPVRRLRSLAAQPQMGHRWCVKHRLEQPTQRWVVGVARHGSNKSKGKVKMEVLADTGVKMKQQKCIFSNQGLLRNVVPP